MRPMKFTFAASNLRNMYMLETWRLQIKWKSRQKNSIPAADVDSVVVASIVVVVAMAGNTPIKHNLSCRCLRVSYDME